MSDLLVPARSHGIGFRRLATAQEIRKKKKKTIVPEAGRRPSSPSPHYFFPLLLVSPKSPKPWRFPWVLPLLETLTLILALNPWSRIKCLGRARRPAPRMELARRRPVRRPRIQSRRNPKNLALARILTLNLIPLDPMGGNWQFLTLFLRGASAPATLSSSRSSRTAPSSNNWTCMFL